MKKPTKRQLKVLNALNPFRVDINRTYAAAAEELNITERAVRERMAGLKARCPDIYYRFTDLRKRLNKGERGMRNPTLLSADVIEQFERSGMIKEIF